MLKRFVGNGGQREIPFVFPSRTQTQEECLQHLVESPKLGRSHTA
jgi:hypothetical protein